MKVLLDENLPHDLSHEIIGHESHTAQYEKLLGVRNGTLLRVAAERGFDAFLTLDQSIEFQTNLTTLPLAIIVLTAPHRADMNEIRPLLLELHAVLAALKSRTVVHIPAK